MRLQPPSASVEQLLPFCSETLLQVDGIHSCWCPQENTCIYAYAYIHMFMYIYMYTHMYIHR